MPSATSANAEAVAERMQEAGYKLYKYDTKLDAEKHGYDGFARIILVAEMAQLIRFHPPNPPDSRSILGLQKNCTNAESCADTVQYLVQKMVQISLQRFVRNILQKLAMSDKAKNQQLEGFFRQAKGIKIASAKAFC